MDVAIIGAGIAGLSCANALREAGNNCTLFDKGRGPGGRMSTRRLQTPLGEVAFDHGAQYFTARDPSFKRLVNDWQCAGIAAPWPEAGNDIWVGVPGMNAMVRHMAVSHKVFWHHLVVSVCRRAGSWWLLVDGRENGPFDTIVLAVPAEQAAAILSLHDFGMARKALMSRSQPCWTGMFAFDRPLQALPDIMRDRGSIAWAARNSAKPKRSGPEAWVVQAGAAWSADRLEASPVDVIEELRTTFAEAADVGPLPVPVIEQAHRWRFALSAGTGDGALWNADLGLGVCGDWLVGPRVESAWVSGRLLASKCVKQGQIKRLRNISTV